MIKISEKQQCCGCYGCQTICPKQCIEMIKDTEGFWYPKVDETQCINCHLCEKVCPVINEYNRDDMNDTSMTLAAWHKDEKIRKGSSSGGIFSVVAEQVLEEDGIVFGAVLDKELNVVHKGIQHKEDLELLRGSKYVQSKIGECYQQAKEFLTSGRKVLFSGTPCQIAGLYAYLKKDYLNLFTCDIVCHGVPSPKVFEKYKAYVEQKKGKIDKINFRDKKYSWKRYSLYMKIKNGKEVREQTNENPYMIGFLKDIYLRPSCYQCKFSKLPRIADISLGDYWGVHKKYPMLDDDKGTSLMIINNDKGKALVNQCKERMIAYKGDLEYAISCNPCIVGSVSVSPIREEFFKDMEKITFEEVINKYMKPPCYRRKMMIRMKQQLRHLKHSLIRKYKLLRGREDYERF